MYQALLVVLWEQAERRLLDARGPQEAHEALLVYQTLTSVVKLPAKLEKG